MQSCLIKKTCDALPEIIEIAEPFPEKPKRKLIINI